MERRGRVSAGHRCRCRTQEDIAMRRHNQRLRDGIGNWTLHGHLPWTNQWFKIALALDQNRVRRSTKPPVILAE